MSDLETCGHICYAARRLGFKIKPNERDGLFSYTWVDLMNNFASHQCEECKTKQEALLSACKTLTEFISCQCATT